MLAFFSFSFFLFFFFAISFPLQSFSDSNWMHVLSVVVKPNEAMRYTNVGDFLVHTTEKGAIRSASPYTKSTNSATLVVLFLSLTESSAL